MRTLFIFWSMALLLTPSTEANNLLTNPNFATDISGWSAAGPWSHNASSGAFGQLGAAELVTVSAGDFSLTQCVDISAVTGGQSVTTAVFVNRVNHSAPVGLEVELFDSVDCSGIPLDQAGEPLDVAPMNFFTGIYTPIQLPLSGAQRALVRLQVSADAAGQATLFDIGSVRFDLITEGHFSNSLASWVQTPAGSWSLVDDGLTTPSGAAEGTVSADGSVFLSQCIALPLFPASPGYAAWIRLKAMDELADYQLSFQFWDNGTCAPPGNLVYVQGLLTRPSNVGDWSFFFTNVPRPLSAKSVAVFIALNAGGGTPGSRFRVDDFIMTVLEGVPVQDQVLRDRFED